MSLPMPDVPSEKIEKEFAKSRAYDIIIVLEREDYDFKTSEWACRAFVTITAIAMQTKNTEAMADFLDDGGCEALVQIMGQYAGPSEEIAANCCLTICILAWSLRDLKEFVGEIGGCELVNFAASMHIGDPYVSEYGSAAIALLAKDDISNSFKLAEDGACDIVAQIGNFGFNIRNSRCVEVATNVCYAFALLSEAVNGSRLQDCGADGLVSELCRLHLKNATFAVAGIKALCGLSSLNAKHREELGRVGACQHAVDVLILHSSTAMAQQAVETIMHLSLSPNNTAKLGAAGACEEIVKALRTKLLEYEFGAEVSAGAMYNLVTYGTTGPENKQKMLDSGAIEVLRQAQFSTKASYRARETILALLELMGASHIPGAVSQPKAVAVASPHNPKKGTKNHQVSLVHGSAMIGDTVPLTVELRQWHSISGTSEYDSFNARHSNDGEMRDHDGPRRFQSQQSYDEGDEYDDDGNQQKVYSPHPVVEI